MNILLLNYPYLQDELKEMGHNITSIGDYDSCDITIPILSYEKIFELIDIAQFDLLIYSDALDKHPLISNFSRFNIPKVYISIDSTINYFWQKYFVSCFDIIFVDQLEVYEKMRLFHSNVYPLLLSHNEKVFFKDNGLNKIYDITFVGRINDNVRMKRSNILNQIKNAGFRLNLIDGSSESVTDQATLSRIYNQSRIVLNESLFPSINLRLFEVLGSGTLLFNEESDNYIKDYFQDKKHLVYYNQANLIERLDYYLKDENERELIADYGYKSAKKYHKDSDRAKFLTEIIQENLDSFTSDRIRDENIFSNAVTALYLNLKWGVNENDSSSKLSLFNQNTEMIYSILKENNNVSFVKHENNKEIVEYFKLCYAVNKKDRIAHVLNSIDLKKLDREKDIDLIQFIFFYSLENKSLDAGFVKRNSDIFNLFIINNLNLSNEIVEYNCKIDEKYYYYYFARYLESLSNIDRIHFGFTQTNISPIFFTQFDFFHFCMQQNIEFEKSTLGMIDILINAKAYDNISVLYGILNKKNPANDSYIKELKKYRHLSYQNSQV